jgi:hypothetical protein
LSFRILRILHRFPAVIGCLCSSSSSSHVRFGVEGFIVFWLTTKPLPSSRRKEKASKTERVCLQRLVVWPSTLALRLCIVRLKIHVWYKKVTEYS